MEPYFIKSTSKKYRVVYALCYPDMPLHSAVFYVGSTGNLYNRMCKHRCNKETSGSVMYQNTPGAYPHVFYYEPRLEDEKQKKKFRIMERKFSEIYKSSIVNVKRAIRTDEEDRECERKFNKRRKRRLEEAGLCRRSCGRKAVKERSRCEICLERDRVDSAARYYRKKGVK